MSRFSSSPMKMSPTLGESASTLSARRPIGNISADPAVSTKHLRLSNRTLATPSRKLAWIVGIARELPPAPNFLVGGRFVRIVAGIGRVVAVGGVVAGIEAMDLVG